MAELLNESNWEEELQGREPLTGSIKLRERDSDSEDVYDDFQIEGVLHAGGSCIAYKAIRYFENSDMAESGILKEFYPVDSELNSDLSYNLKRYDIDAGDMAKQLYSEESTLDNFINAQAEFRQCYEKISQIKENNKANDSFFAPIHIYRGIPSEKGSKNYTIYIWTPGDSALKSFDDYLTEMQKRINDEVEKPSGSLNYMLANELHMILQTIKALAKGIQNLHYDYLLHLDIKPGNFGVRDLGENNGENVSVSLFDVNTIYSRSNPLARTGGTPHFRAPEMIGDTLNNYKRIPIGCLSDIYSLGATLYNAIVVIDKERGLYSTEKFSDLDTALSRSVLFEYSEYNSKADIHDALVRILKRSLARSERDYRGGIKNYISVGEFIADITAADTAVMDQLSVARKEGCDKKASIQLVSKEDYYDSKIDGGAISAMQCLLYDRPLYDYVENGSLNVLVLGAGVFGQRFIDIAFELSQIKDCYLNITVVSKEKQTDEARYLNSRPEIKNYFVVNGEKPKYDKYGAYGSIRFVDVKSSHDNEFSVSSKHNAQVLEETLSNTDEKFGYVFVSLTDEALNKKLACDLVRSGKLLSDNAIVNFVSYKDLTEEERKRKEKEKDGKVYRLFNASYDKCAEEALENGYRLNPVFVKNTLVNHEDYRFLSRMAFNCHLLWCDGLADIKKSYGGFRNAYSYTSSFSNALSVKYKLHSIGLELSDVTGEKRRSEKEQKMRALTLKYRDKIGVGKKPDDKTPEQLDTLNELTMYEHRRWLVNMICNSYTELPAEEYKNLGSSNKDKRNRKHSCIVPSGKSWSLNEAEWRNLSLWSKSDIEETQHFKKLDHLDKMSVLLHRHFMEKAKKFNIETVENDATIIRRYLYGNPEALAAFNVYMISVRAMTSTVSTVSRGERVIRAAVDIQQKMIKHNLEKFKKYLTEDFPNSQDIENRLNNINGAFEIVRAACDFSDYKAKDHTLVYNIPFILNYSTSTRLCMPFIKESVNNEWFGNVASCIVINPSMITYLIDFDEAQKIVSTLKDTLSNITRVMDGHNLQTRIALVLYVKEKNGVIEANKKAAIERGLKEISPRIYSVDIVEIRNQKDLASRIRKTFETNQKSSSRFTAIEINDEFISGAIYSLPDLTIPTFEFNSMKKEFCTEDHDDSYIWFSDIPFNSHLNIEDMFVAQGRLSVYQEPELHRDYKGIFSNCYFDKDSGLRIQKARGWKALCAAIKEKAEKDNLISEIVINDNKINKTEETTLFVPSFCRASVAKLFDMLSSGRVSLIEDANIREYNSAMLEVSFKSTKCVKNEFLKLFNNPYALIDDSKLKIFPSERYLRIALNTLVINDFSWSSVKAGLSVNHSATEEASQKNPEGFDYAVKAFDYLVNKGYIIKFHTSSEGDTISFCFASAQIKKLLTNEGQLLELYTYYQTLEKGYFDEIKTGLEVQRKKADNEFIPTQEFDLIAVKGFRTQMVEIKARRSLQQDFYQKLKSNGDKFGINKKLLLVSDFGRNKIYPDDNEFIKRGKEDYSVETVTRIEGIADELIGIMKKG